MNVFGRLISGAMIGAAAAIVALPTAVSAQEQEADPEAAVVARVNGEEITRRDLRQLEAELRDQLARIPPEQRFSILVNVMIDVRLMARAAEAEGIAEDPEVMRRLLNARDNQLRAEYLRVNAFEAITPEAIEERFNNEIADFVAGDEVRARHILVETREEAVEIIKQLDGGADFAEIAIEKSTDPGSGRNGGDLGFFGRGAMVPPFEAAAFELEVGKYTAEPVESQFGFHIIKLDETRKEPAPTLAARTPELRQIMVREALDTISDSLRNAANIEIVGAAAGATPAQ